MHCTYTTPYNYIEFFLPLAYGSLSILVYLLLIALIIKKKKLHQPFYYYFIFLSLMNIILWINLFLLNRLNRLPSLCVSLLTTFADSSVLLNIFVIIFTITSVGQLLIMMLIAFSRFLAVIWPTKQILPSPTKCILSILVISLLCSSVAFSWSGRYIVGPDGHPVFMADQGWPYLAPAYIISPIGAVVSLAVPLFTLYAVYKLFKGKKQKRNYVEFKLLLTSFCFSLSSICLSIYMIGIFLSKYLFQDDGWTAIFSGVREILLDLATLPAGWLLIVTNKDVWSIFTEKKKFLHSQSTF